jgi:hypothetical protein
MCKYYDETLEPIPPILAPGEKEHVLIPQDECTISTNNHQQPLKKKGNGRGVHISDRICETTGRLTLSPEQIAQQSQLPPEAQLKAMDGRKIIYPGKNYNAWWDLAQLMDKTKIAVDIFEYLHPNKVGIWLFDCSSAHEGLAADALNVNNMNVNPGGKQWVMRDTVIPLTNLPPKPGQRDMRGMPQTMVYPDTHPDPELCRKPKGMKVILQERKSVWDKLSLHCAGRVVRRCKSCQKSREKKDAERRAAAAEAMGQEDTLSDKDISQAEEVEMMPDSEWYCMYCVLSLQEDFVTEKPMIQHYVESRGHVCMFLPKFHCELNPIELLWGYAKYCEFCSYFPI